MGLLAFLALEAGQAHSRETLMGLFWPEMSEADARNNLRVTLARLRKQLEELAQGLAANGRFAAAALSQFEAIKKTLHVLKCAIRINHQLTSSMASFIETSGSKTCWYLLHCMAFMSATKSVRTRQI